MPLSCDAVQVVPVMSKKRVLFPTISTQETTLPEHSRAESVATAAAPRFARPRFVSPATREIQTQAETGEQQPIARAPAGHGPLGSSRFDSSRFDSMERSPLKPHLPTLPGLSMEAFKALDEDEDIIDLCEPQLLGCMPAKIVGMRHQSSAARRCEVGDMLTVAREPMNASDAAAIQAPQCFQPQLCRLLAPEECHAGAYVRAAASARVRCNADRTHRTRAHTHGRTSGRVRGAGTHR